MTVGFTIRVELHGAEDKPDKYEALHKAMEEKEFNRTMKLDGATYELPPAEYCCDDLLLNKQQVLDATVAVAKKVWEDFSVLVTKTLEKRAQYNLKVKG
jgi:hypothetical protein